MTREEYKERFLKRRSFSRGPKATLTVSWETKVQMDQLCTAADSRRISVSNLIENIFKDHVDNNAGTINELYKKDIPVY